METKPKNTYDLKCFVCKAGMVRTSTSPEPGELDPTCPNCLERYYEDLAVQLDPTYDRTKLNCWTEVWKRFKKLYCWPIYNNEGEVLVKGFERCYRCKNSSRYVERTKIDHNSWKGVWEPCWNEKCPDFVSRDTTQKFLKRKKKKT